MTTYSSPDLTGDAAVLADVADRAAIAENTVETIDINGRQVYLVQRHTVTGVEQVLIDPDELDAANPKWRAGTVRPATIDSLLRYVGKHKGEGTEVWVDREKYRFEAVIDDHRAGTSENAYELAGAGGHRAITELRPTTDFLRWSTHDNKLLSQTDFADLLEQGAHNIQSPPAADLIEIAQTLHGTRNVVWKSQQRIDNGQVAFRYEEQLDGRAGPSGDLEIPQTILLALELFRGTPVVNLAASFRWRLNDGRVQLGYRLQQVEPAVDAVLDDMIEQIESRLELDVIMGTPRPVHANTSPIDRVNASLTGRQR
jgi:uncharacterized protein YfdQ (DUF2303 family)